MIDVRSWWYYAIISCLVAKFWCSHIGKHKNISYNDRYAFLMIFVNNPQSENFNAIRKTCEYSISFRVTIKIKEPRNFSRNLRRQNNLSNNCKKSEVCCNFSILRNEKFRHFPKQFRSRVCMSNFRTSIVLLKHFF